MHFNMTTQSKIICKVTTADLVNLPSMYQSILFMLSLELYIIQ